MGQVGRVGPALPSTQSLGVPTAHRGRSSFDSWVQRCPSLARAPLSSRALKPTCDQITVCSPLIYR
jgi:hypothetical protein